jgi:zinc transport system ATP-binding protein
VLRDSLEHLVQVERIAVVYVSHDPEGFAGLADRVVEVRSGRLVDLVPVGAPARPQVGPVRDASCLVPAGDQR